MKKYYFTITTILVFGLTSCSNEETKIQNQVAARPTVPILNGEVRIGQLIWSTKNLNVSRYRNGDIIPEVTDQAQWDNLTTGAWCYYANSTANGVIYSRLYNCYAVNDPRGLAPVGWHIPSLDEWKTTFTYFGGELAAGGSLKSTSLWQSPNLGATNSSGFSALPGGRRLGAFIYLTQAGWFWTTTASSPTARYAIALSCDSTIAQTIAYGMQNGFSIRCVKDNDVTDIEGNTYKGISIGNQIWTQSNLNVGRYRNGDIIPQVTSYTQWGGLTTGAWCYYANNTANGVVYGKLYNWYAVNDPRGLAPQGWHIPNDAEWTTLTNHLGGVAVAGSKMKAITTLWSSSTSTNSSGFSGLPGGYRTYNITGFYDVNTDGYWWSSSEFNATTAWYRQLRYLYPNAFRSDRDKANGISVRCVRD